MMRHLVPYANNNYVFVELVEYSEDRGQILVKLPPLVT